jgi:carbamoyl-phosphate synthase large subunit
MSVLLTCVGFRVDVVNAFRKAGAVTVAVDADPLAPALYHADHHAVVPRLDSPGYLDALEGLARQHDVTLIVPLADLDQRLLAEQRHRLGALVLLPDPEVVELTRDKYLAHRFFEQHGIPSPPTWLPEELPAELHFPLLVKPRAGSGSAHVVRADDRQQLDLFLRRTPVPTIVQTFCRGSEFSIDVFCDLDGRCLNAIPRSMIHSRGGESIKGTTVKDWNVIEFGRLVAETLAIHGPATIQCFREHETRLEVTDVNLRFGGAFSLPTAAGSRYPELALALADGERPAPRLGEFREGLVMTRFFSELFLTVGSDGALAPIAEDAAPR